VVLQHIEELDKASKKQAGKPRRSR